MNNNCPCGVCALPVSDRDFVLCHKACVKPSAKRPPIPSWFDLHTRLKDFMPLPASITQLLEVFHDEDVSKLSQPIRTAEEIVLVPTFVSSSTELP